MKTLKNSVPCSFCGELKVPGGALVSHEKACSNGKDIRRRGRYRDVFFANNGAGPYVCFFCKEDVMFLEVIVHHKDHDKTNDEPANLAPCHRLCHNGHHFKDLWNGKKEELLASETRGHNVPHSDATKKKISDTKKQKNQRPSEEAIAKAAEVSRGVPRSAEVRAKISASHKKRAEPSAQGGDAK